MIEISLVILSGLYIAIILLLVGIFVSDKIKHPEQTYKWPTIVVILAIIIWPIMIIRAHRDEMKQKSQKPSLTTQKTVLKALNLRIQDRPKKYAFSDAHIRKQQDRFGNLVKVTRLNQVYKLKCNGCSAWIGTKKNYINTGHTIGVQCPKCASFHYCDLNYPFHTPEQIKEECEIAIDSLKGFINL